MMANIGRETSDNTLADWLINELADPDTGNAHIDGGQFAGDALTDTARFGNYHQISKKQIVVTRRANKVNRAGSKKELARQIVNKGLELRRDVESIILNNQAASAGNASPPGS